MLIRDSLGRFKKGVYVGFGFRKRNLPWNKGKKGIHLSPKTEFKKGQNGTWVGRRYTIESRLKMSKSLKGKISSMKGKHHTKDTKVKISMFQRKIKDRKMWYGFISSRDKLERKRFKDTLQKQILKRDDYTCQLCGIRGVDLQVDHIQPWAEYIELRFNIENCRTLCAKCHYKITFGKPMPPTVRAWGHNLFKGGNYL